MKRLIEHIRPWGDLIAMLGIVSVILAVKDEKPFMGLLGGILFARGLDWSIEYKIEASKGDSVDE